MPRVNGFSPRQLFPQNSFRKLKPSSGRQDASTSAQTAASPLLNQGLLTQYTEEELQEYREVFNLFDFDRSGAIALDELDAATRHLGLQLTKDELTKIIDEVDRKSHMKRTFNSVERGNHEIDFDEFCVVMRRLTMQKKSFNEVVKDFVTKCFSVFDRSESGVVSKKDFFYILREVGDITDSTIVEEIFNEADVDGNGLIDFEEFTAMVQNYMHEDDFECA